MKPFICAVAWDDAGRVTKYLDFDSHEEASQHHQIYGGVVGPTPGAAFKGFVVRDGVVCLDPTLLVGPTTQAAIKAEAGRRISLLFGGKSGDALVWAQINALATGTYPTSEVQAIRAASDAIETKLATDPYLEPATQPEWP